MSNASNEATAFVPVVRLNDGFRVQLHLDLMNGPESNSDVQSIISLDKIWTTILRQKAWSNRIALVVLSDAPAIKKNIADIRCSREELAIETWDGAEHRDKVLACDSVLGLATLHLRSELDRIEKENQIEAEDRIEGEDPLKVGSETSLGKLIKKIMDDKNPLHDVGIMRPSTFRADTLFVLRFGLIFPEGISTKLPWRSGSHPFTN